MLALAQSNLLAVWQLDLDFEHVQVVLALEVDLDVVGIDIDVLGDDGDQVALQCRQVVRLVAAAGAFVRQDDLQTLFGNTGGLFFLAE